MSEQTAPNKWQPVMIVATHRIDRGQCGALAVFVVLDCEHDKHARCHSYG